MSEDIHLEEHFARTAHAEKVKYLISLLETCPAIAFLGKRVQLKGLGMRGMVTAIATNGQFELCNELEDNDYHYWCSYNEVESVLL